jgi:hypothetical protein
VERPRDALHHLRLALESQPFHAKWHRLLFDALGGVGDGMGQRKLAHARRLMGQAAPTVLPLDKAWNQIPPTGQEMASLTILSGTNPASARPLVKYFSNSIIFLQFVSHLA